MNPEPEAAPRLTLVVHIGDGKTGSSAIQRLLRTEAGILAGGGFSYLGLMLEFAPLKKYEWQRDTRIEAFHALKSDRAAMELAEVLEASAADARRRGLRGLVLSNETLLGRSAAAIEALLKVSAAGIDVRPVVYVRRHDAWARSGYAQWGLRHKTYSGPVKDFAQWCESRRLALYPKLEPWLDAFGDAVSVRNFDATPDVARDFLGVLGIDAEPAAQVRANETPAIEELALRALFNHQLPTATPPVRFNKLLGAGDVDFRLSLGDWLRTRMPSQEQLAELVSRYADDREAVNAALKARGQPPLSTDPLQHAEVELDQEALIGAVFQLLVRQAQRVEVLEDKLAKLNGLVDKLTGPTIAAVAPAPSPGARPPDWEVPAPPGVAGVLTPALGYFGALPTDRLVIDAGGAISALRLSVSEPVRTFLNLGRLEFLRGGEAVSVPKGSWSARQSSVAGTDEAHGPANLLEGKGIHSQGETDPWWAAEFAPPVEVEQIRLTNRSDGWGSRSRTLRVDATFSDGTKRCIFWGQSDVALQRCLDAAASAAGISLPDPLPTSSEALAGLRQQLLGGIATRLRMKQIALADVAWPHVVQLLDVWGYGDEPSRDEWAVIAAFLLAQQQGKAGTSIKGFSLLLNTHSRLERLQQELNDLGHAMGRGGFMLTRHGVKQEGLLRREPARFLGHMMDVIEVLMRMGRDPTLAYGTLLGAIRDGDFIAHDDDVDLLYRSDCTSRSAVEAELRVIKEALRAEGYRVVDLLPNSLNMHVISLKNGAVMDIFPCWMEDGLLQMHMEDMKIRGIDRAIVYPTASVEFLGHRVPTPANPEAYLEERYGPGWRKPDQFFEWPWSLKSGNE